MIYIESMKTTFFLLTFLLGTYSYSQNAPCACCSDEYHQFDFWIGEWDVFDTTGNQVGQNTIERQQDGCVIQENWASKNTTGTSYNYFNATDSTWNQVWIDNQAGSLVLKGKFSDGAMRLRSELLIGKKVAFYRNEIIWTLHDDGTVSQQWNILDENDTILSVAFLGIYQKRE